MKVKTFYQAREEAVEEYNLENLEIRGLITWMAFPRENECKIMCSENELINILNSILKGGNVITSIEYPKFDNKVMKDTFSIIFKKGE